MEMLTRPLVRLGVLSRSSRFPTPAPRREFHVTHASHTTGSDIKAASNIVKALVYPEPSAKHHDLASFVRYSRRSGLDTKSTTYIGTHFEYTVAASLSKYGFYLQRVGGTSDHGIDLLGTWTVPSAPQPLRVLVQCKALAQKIGPHLIRELEGAFVGAPVGWKGPGVIGLLAAEKPATKGVRDSLGRSKWPMGFISCSRTGSVQQMLWNRRTEEEGMDGMGVGMRYPPEAGGELQPVLSWKGVHVPFVEAENRPS